MREIGDSPLDLDVTSAATDGAESEAFGDGTVAAVAASPSTFTIVPRYKKKKSIDQETLNIPSTYLFLSRPLSRISRCACEIRIPANVPLILPKMSRVCSETCTYYSTARVRSQRRLTLTRRGNETPPGGDTKMIEQAHSSPPYAPTRPSAHSDPAHIHGTTQRCLRKFAD